MIGTAVGVASAIALGAVLVPFRTHLSIATPALVLVVPVVVAVILGGLTAGTISVVAGFLVYDDGFVPPYGRLTVGRGEDWVALVVYALVMLLVATVVARLEAARARALDRTTEARRLIELSELLVADRSVEDLLETIVGTVRTVFAVPGVALLVPEEDRLVVAASAGDPLGQDELRGLQPLSGVPVRLDTWPGGANDVRTVALTAAGRPVGMLVMRGRPATEADRAMLRTFANHAAFALERARLREQAVRSELLEEVDRLRHALVGAVSHDLRTPLATMKVASTTLLHPTYPLSDADSDELHSLIDVETDRLTRLVDNLLDMTRIDAGALELRRQPTTVGALVAGAVESLRSTLDDRDVALSLPDDLPPIEVDQLLIRQVLTNLLDNAHRFAPVGSVITVGARARGDQVAISVADTGPGVPPGEREGVFDRFVRFDRGGRAGLGLTIAKTFAEAHGGRIWVEDVAGGGARFVITVPVAEPARIGA